MNSAPQCTHCDSPQGDIREYRAPIAPAAICDGCVSTLAQVLPRHISKYVPDLAHAVEIATREVKS